ncbi:MAG: hypothetical protein LKM44_00385 [Wolbachia endosymbiont of Meromenopon meropis]|nr:hypothetical protein [Wolbachia endosymbiont of Meromenopon meropis]
MYFSTHNIIKLEEGNMTVRSNCTIVCCCGNENDDSSIHPLIYMYKEENERTFCPYCNKLMTE